MNKHDLFFKKVMDNPTLVKSLKKLETKTWDKIPFHERIELFKTIVGEITNFYPELGTPKFEFIFMDSEASGEESEKGTYINVRMLEDGNHFEVLATVLHEIRHFFQRKAGEIYEKTGKVHPLFTKEELEEFVINMARSSLLLVSNYVDASDMDQFEYTLQPIEYDAENFSYEFMRRLSKNFLTDYYDVKNCGFANNNFESIKKMYEGNKHNLIDFDRIYKLNYQDMVNRNKVRFKKDKREYDRYMKWLDKIDYLDDTKLFILLSPCFIDTYSEEMRIKLLNAYLEYNDCSKRIELIDGQYYFNDLLFDMDETGTYAVFEPLFLQVAEDKIKSIVSKDFDKLKFGFEKDVKINLAIKENFISEEKNPLFYRLQPYILLRDGFMKQEYMRLIRSIDNIYDEYNSYYFDFERFLKKYDSLPIITKAEMMTGKKFEEIYASMVEKMKKNIGMDRKTSK